MASLANRSLDRGIAIMEVLAGEGACSLADLNRQTGLPKSTIRRLLGTLMARRLVRRSLSDRKYRINITLPASSGEPILPELALLVDFTLPHAVELTQTVSWPSDIHVVDGHHMRIVDSTRPLSPFHLYRGVVNRKLNIFACATGMACLAKMDDDAIADLHSSTLGDRKWGLARFQMKLEEYLAEIEKTRVRGYGTRLPGYLGETVFDDGLAAIAVPILRNNRPSAALTLLWPRVYRNYEDFAAEFLGILKQKAESISADLEQFDRTANSPDPAH